jgi:hypothetical protein
MQAGLHCHCAASSGHRHQRRLLRQCLLPAPQQHRPALPCAAQPEWKGGKRLGEGEKSIFLSSAFFSLFPFSVFLSFSFFSPSVSLCHIRSFFYFYLFFSRCSLMEWADFARASSGGSGGSIVMEGELRGFQRTNLNLPFQTLDRNDV